MTVIDDKMDVRVSEKLVIGRCLGVFIIIITTERFNNNKLALKTTQNKTVQFQVKSLSFRHQMTLAFGTLGRDNESTQWHSTAMSF